MDPIIYAGIKENCTNTRKKPAGSSDRSIESTDLDWPFPETYIKNIGPTVRGFDFFYPNLPTSLKNFFQPSQNLLIEKILFGTEKMTRTDSKITL